MTIFVDASFLVALFHTGDEFHSKAKLILQKIEIHTPHLLTTNIAVSEAANVVFRLKGAKAAEIFIKAYKKSGIEEIFADKEIFVRGYKLMFLQSSRKGLNFFDCLHLTVMKRLGIDKILSFDKDFEKEAKVIKA